MRLPIYTSEKEINRWNVVDVLKKSIQIHFGNAADMRFLFDFESGIQPLMRKKVYRPTINIETHDNIAHEINTFHTGYFWGTPITLIQRGERDSGTTNEPNAIALLNEQYEIEGIKTKTQRLGKDAVMFDLAYSHIDVNMDYKDGDSFFKCNILSPFTTFIVKSSYYIDGRDMMAVTYREDEKHVKHYTCITNDTRFEIEENKIILEEMNPLGVIPIIEWFCNYDGMGMWEHEIEEMNNLNILVSDFTNDVEQNMQAVWHVNDVEFPTEEVTLEDGTKQEVVKKPKNGDWLQTFTPQNGKSPLVEPLTINYDYANMLANIEKRRNLILQKCYVPQRGETSGGSTGSAMNSAIGWSSLDVIAETVQAIQESCKMKEVKAALAAIKVSPFVPTDSPLLKLTAKDIQPNVKRQHLSEMSTKINGMVALIKCGFYGLHVIKEGNYFSDPEQVWADSKEKIEKFQDSLISGKQSESGNGNDMSAIDDVKKDRNMQDESDQITNSPFVDGIKTKDSSEVK